MIAALAAASLLAAQAHAIDRLAAAALARGNIAGMTVVVRRDGAVAYDRGFGYADLAYKVRASAGTVYSVGALTKQFTDAAVLLLAQEGRLSIDDPLSMYVGGLPWGNRVTLRHLLDEESGIVDFRLGSIDYTTPIDRATVLYRLAQTDLLFAPGSRYQNSSSDGYLLGAVIEKASGVPLARFFQTHFTGPLGLASTALRPAGTAARQAAGYKTAASGPQPVPTENPDWSAAAGALKSSALDLSKWDDALRTARVLKPAWLAAMLTPGVLDDGSSTDYAFGWVVVQHDHRLELWHSGETAGFHGMNAVYPAAATDVVVLTNTSGTFEADRLAVDIFDALNPFVPTPADRAAGARLTEWLGRLRRSEIDRTQLTAALSDAFTAPLLTATSKELARFGALRSIEVTGVDEDAGGRSFHGRALFAKRSLTWIMGIDASGKISALQLAAN